MYGSEESAGREEEHGSPEEERDARGREAAEGA